ncbi:MAG: VWA domain-containing protein, partial [Chloroflexota bacterium]|nr:VWA domain-containing protein [Chloroflexota bacterium]
FNDQNQRAPDNQSMRVSVVAREPVDMVAEALGAPTFQAISPDSSLWLDRLEGAWSVQVGAGATPTETNQETNEELPIGQRRTGTQIRYAVSPVVIVAWESVAQELGWPDQPVGWQTIQRQATQNPDFKWNHPSTDNASGLLATLAEFYAGAGLTRGLTEEAATAQKTLDYVQAVEATVRFYGEGEEVIVQRLASEGRAFLDAFVAPERVVLEWNRTPNRERLVAIYPAEGTLWTDHPLALLELNGEQENERAVTDNQRLVFQAFATFLNSATAQATLLAAGYRPADLSIDLGAAGSPFANTDAVDWRQPQTTLQMPSPAVVDVIQNVWYYTKRPTNVYLVVDSSGSMEGNKMRLAREALRVFVEQIQGERDRVGIVEFGSGTKSFAPLRVLDATARADTLRQIDRMQAQGGTALIDAVYSAITDLQAQADTQAINAIVVMTDGQENESSRSADDLRDLLRSQSATRLVIFTIAFGEDADQPLLRDIAEIGGGQFRQADETDVQELYRVISTYF